jgi:transposase
MVDGRDFRGLPVETQAELRRVAIAMLLVGKTQQDAADAVGVTRQIVSEWKSRYDAEGDEGLDGRKRGRRPGEQKLLDAKQEVRLRRLITEKCPDQLKLAFALWTREAVSVLIKRETGIALSLSAVGNYLRAWGFTAQRPIRRASERREADVEAWVEQSYPAIAKRAKREKAEIQWADETGLSNQANYGRSFAPRGQTPIIPRPAARFSQSMISSLTNQGKLRFMVYDGALNAAIFLEFLKRLVRDGDRKIFLVVDNLRVHRAKIVTAWVADNTDKIELFYLPPYAPDRNPDEFLNNDLKQAMARRRTPKDKAGLKSGLTSYMHSLQKRPAKIKAFFQAPSVRYAA